jgi:cell division protease FtsH
MRQSHKTILIWAILILMFVSIYSMFTDSSSKEKEVDVTTFRADLLNKEKAKEIEEISIEPGGHDNARYVIKKSNSAVKEVVHAEFPGTITKEIYDAGIKYKVKAKDDSSIWCSCGGCRCSSWSAFSSCSCASCRAVAARPCRSVSRKQSCFPITRTA